MPLETLTCIRVIIARGVASIDWSTHEAANTLHLNSPTIHPPRLQKQKESSVKVNAFFNGWKWGEKSYVFCGRWKVANAFAISQIFLRHRFYWAFVTLTHEYFKPVIDPLKSCNRKPFFLCGYVSAFPQFVSTVHLIRLGSKFSIVVSHSVPNRSTANSSH